MRKHFLVAGLGLLIGVTAYIGAGGAMAATAPLNCNLSGYQGAAGLNAAATGDALAVTWDGDRNQELRLRFVIDNGTPTIQELAVRKKGGAWGVVAANVTPEYRVASGRRRMDGEAAEGLRENGITEITPEVFEKYQWDPFWDAPLDLSAPTGRGGNPPPADGVANQPGLPRRPDTTR